MRAAKEPVRPAPDEGDSLTAPPPERDRPAGGRGPGWHGADQADPYDEPPYDEAPQPTADYPAEDQSRAATRPGGRHSRGSRRPDDRPGRADGYGAGPPDDGWGGRPDADRPAQQDSGYGPPDGAAGGARGRGWRGGRAQPASPDEYGAAGYPEPGRY